MTKNFDPMEAKDSSSQVAVIGGGITGLAAAWHLKRAGVAVTVFEASGRAGGMICSKQNHGWLHELGPNSLHDGPASVSTLVGELGLGPRRMFAAPGARNRYVIRRGRLVPVPNSPLGFVATPLFSLRAKLGLFAEPFLPRVAEGRDETVAEFALRRLGRDFLDYAVDPFVAGVYAGDPGRLSLRQAFPRLHALEARHGSLILGALHRRKHGAEPPGRIFSFPEGLGELPRAIASKLGDSLRLNCPVAGLRRIETGWHIQPAGSELLPAAPFRAVICALPADVLASLRIEGVPGAARLAQLKEIEQPPVASVFTGYRRADVGHALDGFGFLAPSVEKRRILGTLFSSTLFPGRAPDGHVALTSFVGGLRQPDLALLEDRELLRVVQSELGGLLGVRSPPVFVDIRRWPRAIPQYNVGFGRFKAVCAAVEADAPGLFIGGNCRDGISLASCVESGGRLAAAALAGPAR